MRETATSEQKDERQDKSARPPMPTGEKRQDQRYKQHQPYLLQDPENVFGRHGVRLFSPRIPRLLRTQNTNGNTIRTIAAQTT